MAPMTEPGQHKTPARDWARPEPFEHDRPTPDPCPPCDSRRQIDAFREWVDTYPPFQTGEGPTA